MGRSLIPARLVSITGGRMIEHRTARGLVPYHCDPTLAFERDLRTGSVFPAWYNCIHVDVSELEYAHLGGLRLSCLGCRYG